MMVVAGVVAGLVALRLRAKFRYAFEQAATRNRVTNLFGQHVSPAVVDRLLASPLRTYIVSDRSQMHSVQ
jgi:adenylate cyclase